MVAVSVIMAAVTIVDEVTSQGDPWEKPAYEGVLDPTSDAE